MRAAQGGSDGASSSSAQLTATAPKKAASKASRCVAHAPRPASQLHSSPHDHIRRGRNRKLVKPPKTARPSEAASSHANGSGAAGKSVAGREGASGSGSSSAKQDPIKQDPESDDDLDDFDIQEATEKIEAKPSKLKGRGRPQSTRKVWLPPPSLKQPAFELTPSKTIASCEEAYQLAVVKPRWEIGDVVEVAWSGKGFEGGWSTASVIQLDGRDQLMVRFQEFVDNDGSPLVEKMTHDRLRLPPPTPSSHWAPFLGEKIEGLWNDCWWEGIVREFHPFKGLLFQYDRYANWLWLPFRCTRPRPPLFLYYPQRESAALESVDEEEGDEHPPGLCGQQGCMLRNNHLGLCQVRTVGTRRENMKEKAELQQQEQLWHEIKSSREASTKVAEARAEALLKTEQVPTRPALLTDRPLVPHYSVDPPASPTLPLPPPRSSRRAMRSPQAGADIKAPRGNRAQWHAHFQLDEFIDTARDVPVMHECEAGLQLRGMLIIGPGHTLADAYHMLRTELQIEPEREAYMVTCLTPHDSKRFSFSAYSPQTEVLGLLPSQPCQFLLDQTTTKSKQPKFDGQ